MTAAVLLCLALVAVDSPTVVRAKVLYGTSPDQQHRADIEPWITQMVAKAGSPLAQPYTDWLPLGNDEQELYSSMQGGRLIKGKATEKDGSFEVQISGFKIKPLKQTVLLRPGAHRVVRLTDYPPPRNVFIALEAPLSGIAEARAGKLKSNVEDFHLQLDYNGQEDKPFYRLILSVPPIGYDRSNPFYRLVQIGEGQAVKIIDDLGADGFLDRAVDLQSNVKLPPPTMPGYTLTVATKGLQLRQDLGWDLPMIRRLDALRTMLDGDAAKEMDLLLGRLSGLRAQCEKASTQPDFSKLKEGITLSQAREILGSTGRLRRNSTAREAIYDFDFDGKSAVLIVNRKADPAIVTKVIIWEHGKTVQEVRAQREKKWIEWVEARSPKKHDDEKSRAEEPVYEKDGLAVFLAPSKPVSAADMPLSFDVTFQNVSAKAFTLLTAPTLIDRWGLQISEIKGDKRYKVVRVRLRRLDVVPGPLVLKAGDVSRLQLVVGDNHGYQLIGGDVSTTIEHLPPGKYTVVASHTCHGATKNVEIAKLPPLWVGEITTEPVAFEIVDKSVGKMATDPATAKLVQALEDWIILLEAHNTETAQKRWANDSEAADQMKQWWAKLSECHRQYDYRKWLDGAKQIGDAKEFKVGGHDYGHRHVDWKKADQGWRIAKVWICP